MWKSAFWNFSFCFSGVFHFYWQNFHFGGRTKPWAIFYEVLRVCWYFLISWDPNINSLGNLWGNSFVLCLLLTITLGAFSYACASQQNFKISWKCFVRFLDCLTYWVNVYQGRRKRQWSKPQILLQKRLWQLVVSYLCFVSCLVE